jgi:hypothetical protein
LKHYRGVEVLFFLPDGGQGWKLIRGGKAAQ